MTNEDKYIWLKEYGTFITTTYTDENMGTSWLDGVWISRNCAFRHNGIGPDNITDKAGKMMLAALMFNEIKQCLYETTMVPLP